MNKSVLNTTLIIRTRRSLKFSQQRLADLADCSQDWICRIESGIIRNPPIRDVYLIAVALNLKIEDMIINIKRATDIEF